MPPRSLVRRLLSPGAFLLALLPLAYLVWQALDGRLSANPIDDITDTTGTWTLRFVLITLAIRPLRKVPGLSALASLRRMAGLFAFFYGVLHLATYLWLDQFFDVPEILKDVAKRPFITAGVSAFLLMVPLALTSTQGMMRRLGGARWKALHRLVYLTAIGGVIHYLWLVKADRHRPLIYGAIVALLLGYRIWEAVRSRRSRPPTPTTNHGTI
jgi:sulfoxide reductase heme-binding subunit YedZ